MINAIVNGIFWLVTKLASALLTPIVAFISALFPDLGTAITQVTSFLGQVLVNIPMILELCFIPRSAIVFLFDYIVIKYAIYIYCRGVICAMNIYEKFKL